MGREVRKLEVRLLVRWEVGRKRGQTKIAEVVTPVRRPGRKKSAGGTQLRAQTEVGIRSQKQQGSSSHGDGPARPEPGRRATREEQSRSETGWGVRVMGGGQGDGVLDRSLDKVKESGSFTARGQQGAMGRKKSTPDPKSPGQVAGWG